MRHDVALLLLLLCLVACGGGGDTTDPGDPSENNDPPPFEVTSGFFTLTATVSVNGCELATDWNGTYEVQIDSLTVTLGDWQGTWNPNTVGGIVESPKAKITTRDCTITNWTTAYITFTSPDAFRGSFNYRHRVVGDCPDLVNCSSSWLVRGARIP